MSFWQRFRSVVGAGWFVVFGGMALNAALRALLYSEEIAWRWYGTALLTAFVVIPCTFLILEGCLALTFVCVRYVRRRRSGPVEVNE